MAQKEVTRVTDSSRQRLDWLAQRVSNVDRPYLITGPQATYHYHRWLTPLRKLATLQVYEEDLLAWHQMASDACLVFETPPTASQVQAAQAAIILDPTLDPAHYQRRWLIDGLAFVAPEDLCLDLLERARGETSVAEAAAILLVQREALDWELLVEQAAQRGLSRRLGALLEAINAESEGTLISSWVIDALHHRTAEAHGPAEAEAYPAGRHRSVPPLYRPISERWGVPLTLPRYVIGKVLFDLQLQPQTE